MSYKTTLLMAIFFTLMTGAFAEWECYSMALATAFCGFLSLIMGPLTQESP